MGPDERSDVPNVKTETTTVGEVACFSLPTIEASPLALDAAESSEGEIRPLASVSASSISEGENDDSGGKIKGVLSVAGSTWECEEAMAQG
jgi:hypothetical protein